MANQTSKKQTNSKANIGRLCVTAVMLALSTVLSMITVVKMPMGGSVTPLSMLPIVILSVMYGTRWGIVSAFFHSLIQLFVDISAIFSWGLSAASVVGTITLDYILAFTVLGLAGVFKKRTATFITLGTALVIALRFLCHFLSGVIIFGEIVSSASWIYSLSYNGTYMLPELVLTAVATAVIFKIPQVRRICKI